MSPLVDPSEVREERKVVTSLFADIVGSTSMAERFDPEDVREVIGESVARMCTAVEDFGGSINDLAGDGVLALFGAPVTHEDDPDRAIRAGLRIVEELGAFAEEVAERYGVEGLAVRVGIQTGLVALGLAAAGQRAEYVATGDALNTAARLQAHARPGSVLVGEATRRLAGKGFEWGEPLPLELKGKAEPVVAFEVRGLARHPVAETEALTPLLGRERELGICRRALDALASGMGGMLAISGLPGVGKSRMVAELRRAAPVTHWLEGRAVSYGQALPYWIYRDAFRSWLGASPGTDEAHLRSDLRARLAALDPRSEEAYPYLGMLMGLSLESEWASAVAQLSPEAVQYRTFEAVRDVIRSLARSGPTVLVVEDLHWADSTSLALTERLLDVTETLPLLLVVTARGEPEQVATETVRRWAARLGSIGSEVLLDALTGGADRKLLSGLVGEGTLPAAVERRILGAAEGNPFFLEELVRSLQDAGAVVRSDGGWRFDREVEFEVPPTVERVILARIDRLPATERLVLTSASVLGREFALPLLSAVAELDGALPKAVEGLVALDLLQGGAASTYRFKHALIQETAYRSLLKKRRRELHARAAAAIEELFAGRMEEDRGILGVLAHHYGQAGDQERALEYHSRAARSARSVYAVQEATEHYTKALALAEPAGDRSVVWELRLERGQVRAQAGEIAGAREDFERALSASEEASDVRTRMRALNELGFLVAGAADYEEAVPLLTEAFELAEKVGDAGAQAVTLSRLSILDTNRLRLDRAIESGERALVLARQAGDGRSLAMALDALEVASVIVGDFPTVDRIAPELVDIHRTRGDLWYLQFALFQWAWVPLASCRWEEAEARVHQAWTVNRDIGDRGNESFYPATLSWIERARGRYDTALRLGREAMASAEAVGHRECTAFSAGLLGRTLLEMLRAEEAVGVLERSTRTAQEAHALIELPRAVCLLALAKHVAGDRDQALQHAARGEGLLDGITAPAGRTYLQVADAPVALGMVWLREGESDRAARLVEPVLAAARASGWAEVAAWASLILGRATQTPETLHEALGEAEDVGLPGVIWRAHAALAHSAEAEGHRDRSDRHRQQAGLAIETLSASIADETMRRRFVERAAAAVRKGACV